MPDPAASLSKINLERNRGLSQLSIDTEYRTGEGSMSQQFFEPCLLQSIKYDRAVGYFRSSVFVILGDAMIDFVKRGGKIRFVCSPELGPEDLKALAEGFSQRDQIMDRLLEREVRELLSSDATKAPTELLATLIAIGALDVRIAVRPPSQGIYHEKIGVFRDSFQNAVTFKGSANETWHGWHDSGNLESIEVFCSWESRSDAARVQKHLSYFERLWGDEIPGITVMSFPEAAHRQLCSVAHSTLDDWSRETHKRTNAVHGGERKPLDHQTAAIANWTAAGRRGVLQHATGSGKTFTALLAIHEHLAQGLPALVVVPSKLLLKQWQHELLGAFPAASLLLAGGGNTPWKRPGRLESFTSPARDLGMRIVLATMQTAAKREFRSRIRSGAHLMIVADEVHQTGSPENAQIFEIETGSRLGLSATPERLGDPDGTAALFNYFGDVVPPIVNLEDAIVAGRLVPYSYHPHAVYLTSEESDQWKELTKQIGREIARQSDGSGIRPQISDRAKLLLIQRSRIAKKASRKIALAVEVLRESFVDGDRWLIYCEDLDQLQKVIDALRATDIPASEYYSGMPGDGEATLAWLREFGGIVVSVRCLDEGVDIPSVSHALILASSRNPRQFIQRRGRVLRRSPDKYSAVVHDAIVVPPDVDAEPEQLQLAVGEIRRALEFARSALNLDASAELRDIAAGARIDLESPGDLGFEDGDEDTIDTSL